MIDEEATRAAARALYQGIGHTHYDVMSDTAIIEALMAAQPRLTPRQRMRPPCEPKLAPEPQLDAGQIETIMRSVPQICAHCRLLSNADAKPCPSPRGHYFVTDYPAMAEKVRSMTR